MKYKMMLLSLSSVIFLTIIGGLGYIQGNKLADASREMYADRLLPISSFNEIDKRFVQVETDILKLIITEERSLKDDLIADLRDHILMIEELLYEFEQQGISQEFALLIADIKSKINTYRGDIQEMVDLAVVRDSNAAYQHYLDTTENRKEIERLVNEISLNSQQIAKHLNDENQSNLQFYNRITLFSFVTSFIVTAFIGFAISTSITRPLDRLNTKLEQFGNGDLSAEMAKDSGKDELAHIQNSTLAMKENLTKLITNVNFSSNRLTESISKQRSTIDGNQASTIQINHLIKEISEGAYQQAARANEILAMLDSSSKNTNAGHVKVEQTLANATESTRIAKEGKEFIAAAITQLQGLKQSIYEATTSVSQLNQRSSEIGTIITTITKISDQTNLLALNAAIEAARAGETGRGFAVVADEVRKLAEETSYSASRITELIQTIQLETTTTFSNMEKNLSAFQEQHELIEKGGYALEHIVEQVEETELSTNELEEIFNTLEKNSNEVLRSVEEITASLEQTAAATEQVSTETEQQHQRATGMKSSADHLEEVNKNLNTELKKFKL